MKKNALSTLQGLSRGDLQKTYWMIGFCGKIDYDVVW